MNPLNHACPTCKAAPSRRCRTLTTGRTTDTHQARWDEVDLAIARNTTPTKEDRVTRYRKKPVVIDAMQFTGDNHAEVEDWATSNGGPVTVESAACSGDGPPYVLAVHTLEGQMICGRGYWLIKGVQGEFYPCKPDIFDATYEPAGGAA